MRSSSRWTLVLALVVAAALAGCMISDQTCPTAGASSWTWSD
jgi:hypothetical protein